MTRRILPQRGRNRRTPLHHKRAARMKGAPRRRIQRRRHLPRQHNLLPLPPGMRRQRRRNQRLRIGMLRVGEQLHRRRLLHNLPQIHNSHHMAHIPHRRQIVGNQQVTQLVAGLQLLQQVQYLRPDGHIQRRHRLVQHNQTRPGGQRPRNRNPLPLPAAELVRIPLGVKRVQPHHLQQLLHLRPHRRPTQPLVRYQRLGNYLIHPHPRV